MARPSIYTKELADKTREYLSRYEEFGDAIPSVAGLSHYLQIARSTIYDWAGQDDKKEFSDILESILSDQERVLINKGLKGEFNANIAKLALGKHGYTDKADVTSGGKIIPIYGGLSGLNGDQDDIQTKEED